MKVGEVIEKAVRKEIRWIDAARILDLSDRQLRRMRARYSQLGVEGLKDLRKGKAPRNRIDTAVAETVLRLYREQYPGFNVRHFCEQLKQEHQVEVSYSWTKGLLHDTGLVRRHPKRGKYRRRRQRCAMRGQLVHLDGSKHRWFHHPEDEMQDLLVFLDDATGEVLAARFVREESTATVIELLAELVTARGTFASLYTDRASHFVFTPKAGEPPDRSRKTQVEQILDDLGTQLICAYSPQARGRSERLWRTLQGRLPQELKRFGAKDYETANMYLNERFLDRFNRQFSISPAQPDSAFVSVTASAADLIFTLRYERTVNPDHTVRFQNRVIQLPKPSDGRSLARRRVSLRLSLDGTLSIFLGKILIHKERLEDFSDPELLVAA